MFLIGWSIPMTNIKRNSTRNVTFTNLYYQIFLESKLDIVHLESISDIFEVILVSVDKKLISKIDLSNVNAETKLNKFKKKYI